MNNQRKENLMIIMQDDVTIYCVLPNANHYK